MSQRQITLSIDTSLDDVFLVGLAVSKICSFIRLTELECYQMEVCVVEAVTSAIKYAYGGENCGRVDVAIAVLSDRVQISVRDSGKALSEEDLGVIQGDPARSDFSGLSESGRGLFIVGGFMDQLSYASEEGQNTLSMVKSLVPVRA